MDRPISRRDFFDGVTMVAATTALGSLAGRGAPSTPLEGPGRTRSAAHPAAAQGLRGNTPDALAVPHALRDGRFWERAGEPEPTGERYDLVVVGAGVSGVTAAYAWTRRHPRARVLVLDNHDDIGGQARRNEFHPAGRAGPLVSHGGSGGLYAPSEWSRDGRELLADLGVEVSGAGGAGGADPALYPGLGMHEAVFCDRESFGADRLVRLAPGRATADWVAELPVAARAREELALLYDHPPDWFPGLSGEEKKRRLAALTYTRFLREVCGAHPDVVRFCQTMPSATWAHGADALGALDAWLLAGRFTYPGFAGLGLDASHPSPLASTRAARGRAADAHPFPEGNQALVRMMVARMVPGFAGAASAGEITTTRLDRGALDRAGNRVRVRLSSPVVLVRADGTVGYFDGARVRTVRGGAVVMACGHTMIPYLVQDLPAEQKDAMRQAVRMPLVHATVQLRDWRAWHAAGVHRVRFTGAYWASAELAVPVSTGSYRCPREPGEPVTAHLVHAPAPPGVSPRDAAAAGRRALAATPYSALEYGVRQQLARLLGPWGFDPARDVEGLTVNRWGHGHAREYTRPWDAFHPAGPLPSDTARRRFGRVAMAGADAVPGGDVDAAVTAACQAVRDLEDA
ncbi:NAD(P)-binding protein [Sphaerisporangium sp. TRM90804]|uniref:NAD(P)-binding protein n=1 Tax=Sphaerisporangium sp. TRM90804 TaxID=3031113 RepID=UPI002449E36F|nr:NAD(P)-binding protein [Sphaerisporangium sp. TRM90804]MDH2426605.1 FAD-dependent oxidoreductase [Sphaerisporangium sp. TRM90804]